ncbi:MAG: hypothetical protein SFW36_01980 [Leptolyngbyaceae cyanobacterium bins.59]|nr:hypothetical protein [Leptolyngbyaceae cyanobacterium bins.59]
MTSQVMSVTTVVNPSNSGLRTDGASTSSRSLSSGDALSKEGDRQVPNYLNKAFSRIDHQVEFLHLQAEADALLTHLQAVKQQRLTANN